MQTQTAIRADPISRRFTEYESSVPGNWSVEFRDSAASTHRGWSTAGAIYRLAVDRDYACLHASARACVDSVRVASRPHPDDFGLRSVCLARDTTLQYAKGRPSLSDLVLFILSRQASRPVAREVGCAALQRDTAWQGRKDSNFRIPHQSELPRTNLPYESGGQVCPDRKKCRLP
jgi:hypothetical protein